MTEPILRPTTPLTERFGQVDALNESKNRRILIRNACVLTQDPAIGDLARGDVLVEGNQISQVGVDLEVEGTDFTVIDAQGCIVLPGFIDTHRHMWQGQLRRLIPNVDIAGYLAVRNAFAVEYRPDDSHISTLAMAYGALYSGVTTVLDLAHNTRSADHADAEIDALRVSGIRAVYACAPPEAGKWAGQWPGDLARLKDVVADESLVTLRMAQRCFSDADNLEAKRIAIARDLGIGMTIDPVGWDESSAAIKKVAAEGLLGPDMTLVHCCDLSDDSWRAMGDAGVGVSLSPFVDEILGWGAEGLPTVQKALDVGLMPGISVDIETTVPADIFTQMRSLIATQRMRGSLGNPDSDRSQLTAREVLGFATRGGAGIVDLAYVCGTLTPGKDADILILDCSSPNLIPMTNAYGIAVMGADVDAVRMVMVSGVVKKWGSSLVGVDMPDIQRRLEGSRDLLAKRVGFVIDPFADYPTIIPTA